jgi:DNA polymerase III subunit epsilon
MSTTPQRMVILDTETTGLSAELGHRIIEIGCIEIVNRRLSGRSLHLYLNPGREVDEAATEVHGLTWDDLRDKPRFGDAVAPLREFVDGALVLIHNAAFDESFLDKEFRDIGLGRFTEVCNASVDCTLKMARELHPGKRNSLDALCERYGVSHSHRKLHGALLDAELLAEVYLAMTRGQESLEMALDSGMAWSAHGPSADWPPVGLRVIGADAREEAAHQSMLARQQKESKKPPLWAVVAPVASVASGVAATDGALPVA